MRARERSKKDHARRPGAVALQVAVGLTAMVGFMALSIDLGHLYNVKAELQSSADAAALAAAPELGQSQGDPMQRARDKAREFANRNLVLGRGVELDETDFTFGIASINKATNKYVFTPTNLNPNALKVRLRRSEGSPSGPVPLLFARVFGIDSSDIAAEATAVLTPRDICFVLDLSLSHSFDSQLMHYRLTDIGGAMKNVWTHLKANGGSTGPTFGNMNTFGTEKVDANWNYASDPGLKLLRRGQSWGLTSSWVSQSLAEWRNKQSAAVKAATPAAYTSAEMAVINSASGAGTETSTSNSTQKANYRRRVLVALGIYRWKSGKPGGQPGGDGDNIIDANEVELIVPYPSSSNNPSGSKPLGGSWDAFVDYVSDIAKADNVSSNTGLTYRFLRYDPENSVYGNPQLRSRFGIKTFLDYVQQQQYRTTDSPGLAGAPQQPMGAVAQGAKAAIQFIKNLEGNDQIGVAAYGQIGYGPMDKPANLSWLTDDFDGVLAKIDLLQAGMWDGNTNIAAGIDKAVKVLEDSPNARSSATKIIFLLTDGRANIPRNGGPNTSSNEKQARLDTIAAATDAANKKCRIYTIAVGADADVSLMQQIAQIGRGESFMASGDIAEYEAQLQNIFLNLGGKRPVALIQ